MNYLPDRDAMINMLREKLIENQDLNQELDGTSSKISLFNSNSTSGDLPFLYEI
jgi:hypothetical protein